jgi:RecJ-like exonuclease
VTLVEAVMLRRAQEQLRDVRWKRRDRDEPVVAARACHRCEGSMAGVVPQRKLCDACHGAGWTTAFCGCGTRLHRRDQKAQGQMQGLCGACRMRALEERFATRIAGMVRVSVMLNEEG